ncbi:MULTISPECIES: hypothetical protein [Planomicrobium]|uniref:Cytochrome b561 domain-containing protein n=2 Tax=Planomicrobium okeanokoites TaxID=244 RepID=A0ABV7KKA8_PLAOK|nr:MULTISPECIES: hypothetical protein [Planomicrobium]RLQ90779.1 hypothetical protein D9754_08245 [Planomicrobium sp. Y74]TAA68836.1 hypothetical protein D2910_10395 [Planomicrobium okeanokoites]
MKRIHIVNGIILAFSVILVRYIDVHVYDMHIILNLLVLVGLIVGGMKIAERFPALDYDVSRKTGMIINTIVVLTIFLAFFVLELG